MNSSNDHDHDVVDHDADLSKEKLNIHNFSDWCM